MARAALDAFLKLGFLDDPLQIFGIADGDVGVTLAAVLAEVKPRVEGRLGRPVHELTPTSFLDQLLEDRCCHYGVEPHQVPDFIAIRGDASDRIPGAIGIGAIGAATLLRKYRSLQKAIAAGRLSRQADQLRLYRSIATMDKSAPLPALRDQKPAWGRAAALARDWQLNRLPDRLDSLA
jgi:hypothetical protein